MTTLEEVGKFLSKSNADGILQDGDFILDYIKEIDVVATDILGSLSKEKASAVGSVFQSFVISYMMDKGEINGKQLEFLVSDQFSMIVILLFKMSVGIAALEEMR